MKYVTVSAVAESKFTEKGSKFIGHVFPADSEAAAETHLHDIRKKYYDATHNCWAWRIGSGDDEQFRYSDDGEPNGTAGRPIYGSILKSGMTNLIVIVTRYFGGTKLGTGGLVRAYAESAGITLNAAVRKTVETGEIVRFICSYEEHPILLREINTHPVIRFKQEFGEKVVVEAEIDAEYLPSFISDVCNAGNGKLRPESDESE